MKMQLSLFLILASSFAVSESLVDLVSGNMHNCVLSGSGEVYCWGLNGTGELGIQSHEPHSIPQKLNFGEGQKVRSLAAGSNHTCVILENDRVKCWGVNTNGHLGLGKQLTSYGVLREQSLVDLPPIDFGKTAPPKKLALGGGHSCILFEDGKVKCWGANHYGQLGLGDQKIRGINASEMGEALPYVDLGGKVIEISSGQVNTCAVLQNGDLKCWGFDRGTGAGHSNAIGIAPNQMGAHLKPVNLGSQVKVKQLTSAQYIHCAVTDQFKVKCFGNNLFGSLGIGKQNNDVVGDDPSDMGDNLPFLELGEQVKVKSVSCGWGHHCCAHFENNTVKCWGRNQNGQLGRGDQVDLGGQNLLTPETAFVPLGAFDKVSKITLGGKHTCVLLTDSQVKCWGSNRFHQLGWEGESMWGIQPQQMGDALKPVNFPKTKK